MSVHTNSWEPLELAEIRRVQRLAREQAEAERDDRVGTSRRAAPVVGVGYTHPTRPRRR